jgi:hypothetical protein
MALVAIAKEYSLLRELFTLRKRTIRRTAQPPKTAYPSISFLLK